MGLKEFIYCRNYNVLKIFSRKQAAECGSVMMEYVIILLVMGTLLMYFSKSIYSTGEGLGIVGREIADNYQRIMSGISLPTP